MGKTTVYLPDDLLKSLENKTRKDDIKKSQLVQRALKKYFENGENEDEDSLKQEVLESKVEDIEKIQDAILKNLNLKVKNKIEPEEIEDEILLVGDDEDDQDEDDEEDDED